MRIIGDSCSAAFCLTRLDRQKDGWIDRQIDWYTKLLRAQTQKQPKIKELLSNFPA